MATFVHSLQFCRLSCASFTQTIEFLLSLKSDLIIFVLPLGLQGILNTKCFVCILSVLFNVLILEFLDATFVTLFFFSHVH